VKNAIDHLYILATIALTVYGQFVLKWRLASLAPLPDSFVAKIQFFLSALLDPYIASGFLAAFMASFAWMVAMTKFQLSYAYPFMSLNFVVVVILSAAVLGEQVSLSRLSGVALIVAGTLVIARD